MSFPMSLLTFFLLFPLAVHTLQQDPKKPKTFFIGDSLVVCMCVQYLALFIIIKINFYTYLCDFCLILTETPAKKNRVW